MDATLPPLLNSLQRNLSSLSLEQFNELPHVTTPDGERIPIHISVVEQVRKLWDSNPRLLSNIPCSSATASVRSSFISLSGVASGIILAYSIAQLGECYPDHKPQGIRNHKIWFFPLPKLNPPQRYAVRSLPTEIPVTGEDEPDDGCDRQAVRMDDGRCARLLSSDQCPYMHWVLMNKQTRKGECVPRLCQEGKVFVESDQMCHAVNEPDFCPARQRLYMTAWGEAVCDCNDGTFHGPDGQCHGLYEPAYCDEGTVLKFHKTTKALTCKVDLCHGQNSRRRGPKELPFARGPRDNACYRLGSIGPCSNSEKFGYDIENLSPACIDLQEAGLIRPQRSFQYSHMSFPTGVDREFPHYEVSYVILNGSTWELMMRSVGREKRDISPEEGKTVVPFIDTREFPQDMKDILPGLEEFGLLQDEEETKAAEAEKRDKEKVRTIRRGEKTRKKSTRRARNRKRKARKRRRKFSRKRKRKRNRRKNKSKHNESNITEKPSKNKFVLETALENVTSEDTVKSLKKIKDKILFEKMSEKEAIALTLPEQNLLLNITEFTEINKTQTTHDNKTIFESKNINSTTGNNMNSTPFVLSNGKNLTASNTDDSLFTTFTEEDNQTETETNTNDTAVNKETTVFEIFEKKIQNNNKSVIIDTAHDMNTSASTTQDQTHIKSVPNINSSETKETFSNSSNKVEPTPTFQTIFNQSSINASLTKEKTLINSSQSQTITEENFFTTNECLSLKKSIKKEAEEDARISKETTQSSKIEKNTEQYLINGERDLNPLIPLVKKKGDTNILEIILKKNKLAIESNDPIIVKQDLNTNLMVEVNKNKRKKKKKQKRLQGQRKNKIKNRKRNKTSKNRNKNGGESLKNNHKAKKKSGIKKNVEELPFQNLELDLLDDVTLPFYLRNRGRRQAKRNKAIAGIINAPLLNQCRPGAKRDYNGHCRPKVIPQTSLPLIRIRSNRSYTPTYPRIKCIKGTRLDSRGICRKTFSGLG